MNTQIIPRIICSESKTAISPFYPGCEELFFKWFNDPRIYLHMGDLDQFPFSIEDAKRYVESHKKDTWLIIANIGNEKEQQWVSIGYIGMFIRSRHKVGIIRYAIGEIDFLRKGHVSRAIKSFCDWSFNESNLFSIHASVSGANPESINVLRKLEFVGVGKYSHSRFENGNRYDEFLFELLNKNYL